MCQFNNAVAQIKRVTGMIIGSGFCLFCCGLALADEPADAHPFLSAKFNVQLGVYSPRRDITVRVDGSIAGENGSIDFDDELGARQRDDIFAAELIWRFGKKWSLRTQYFDSSGSKSSVLATDIEWGDDIIEAGSSVTAGTSFTLSRIFFGRSFDNSPKYDYGIGLGLHWLKTGAFIERDIIISFGEASTVSASGPLPNIGGWLYYSPSSKWLVGGRLDWLQASVGDYAGGILNLALGANYQLTDHFGVGAKYQVFELNADVKKSNIWRGRMNTEFEGAYVYLSGNW
jgi:hypothetical protein